MFRWSSPRTGSAPARNPSKADEVLCLRTPEPFYAVGLWYGDFSQTTDEEVHSLLERASEELAQAAGRA